MIQYVALQKLGGANLYISYQESRATPNQSFTLGNEDGDEFNILTGSPTGTLDAGDIYRLIVQDAIEASPSAASGSASASGFLTIALTPEPATAFLLGLGLVGLGMARRRAIRG